MSLFWILSDSLLPIEEKYSLKQSAIFLSSVIVWLSTISCLTSVVLGFLSNNSLIAYQLSLLLLALESFALK